jgi:hypothetical protein
MDDFGSALEVSLEVVYDDEDMVELAAIVNARWWRGRCYAYTVPSDISRFAEALLKFADGGPSTAFEAGADNGYGFIGLRFYRIDRSGHIAGHARLASSGVGRSEQVSRLAVEFGTETWALIQFARQLADLAQTKKGRATLAIEAEL